MPVSVTMPRLGESVTEGTVTRWLKQEGDHVEADEPLLEVSTDKVDTEIPSPASGVLTRIVVAEDETVEVGSELAVISGDGDGGAAEAQPDEQPTGEAAGEAEAPSTEQPVEAEQPATEAQRAQAEKPKAHEAAQPTAEQPAAEQPAAEQPAATGTGTPVKMPALGESVTEGTVTRWLKAVGDRVEADEPLLEVSTDKVDTEIPSPVAGTLLEIRVGEDETVDVGAELAVIGSADSASAAPASAPVPAQAAPERERTEREPAKGTPATDEPAEQEAASRPTAEKAEPTAEHSEPRPTQPAQPAQPAKAAQPAQAAQAAAGGNGGQSAGESVGYVTPLVRKLAGEHGVDLGSLRGTGVGGRIRKQDVLEAAERKRAEAAKAEAANAKPVGKSAAKPAADPSPLRGRTEKMSRLRSVIAKRMVESLHVSAQLTTVVEVDVTRIARLRDRAKREFERVNGVKLSFLPFFALAAVEALKAHPTVNASINTDEGTVTYHDAEHLAIAVDTERGLMVPVIRNAGELNLVGLAKRIADLAARTRTMKIEPDDLSGGTFTLTNTGSRGALFDTPIINQPQVGILGTGAVVKRAVVVSDPDLGDAIVPRSMVYLALSYDHRLVDGADAARFLSTIKDRMEGGAFESELGLS